MRVVTVHWPAEEALLLDCREGRVARLVVFEDGPLPGPPPDCLEEWVGAAASDDERSARLAMLEARVARHRGPTGMPELVPDGRLWHRGQWVALSPGETRLAGALLDRFGAVVDRATLAAARPDGAAGRTALDTAVARLRRRLAPLGLEIRTIRMRGYLMQDSGQTADPET